MKNGPTENEKRVSVKSEGRRGESQKGNGTAEGTDYLVGPLDLVGNVVFFGSGERLAKALVQESWREKKKTTLSGS